LSRVDIPLSFRRRAGTRGRNRQDAQHGTATPAFKAKRALAALKGDKTTKQRARWQRGAMSIRPESSNGKIGFINGAADVFDEKPVRLSDSATAAPRNEIANPVLLHGLAGKFV